MEVVKVSVGPTRTARTGMLPDEIKVLTEYSVAQYNVSQASDKTFPNNKPSEDPTYHYSRWDPKFGYKGIKSGSSFQTPPFTIYADHRGRQRAYAAKRAEKNASRRKHYSANSQAASGWSTVRQK